MIFNKEKQALKKIKQLQKFLNKHFPDTDEFNSQLSFEFTKAEDFLTEEARQWRARKIENRELN
tara:strand:+ start:7148 stop:7339 length:192 start_codon:yes stop_codon:yes gene_type:complete